MTILLLSLLVFLIIGVPVAYSLGLSTFVYFVLVQPDIMHVLPQLLFSGMESYALIALPLFILMGQVMNEGGITQRLIQFCLMFVGRFRGGLGVLYAILVGFFLTRHLTLAQFYKVLRASILTSAKIMMIIGFSQVFIWVLALERVPELVASLVEGKNMAPFLLLIIIAIILIAGTFIDVSPAILLLTPVFLPAVTAAAISPILFGVILVTDLAVGACNTPCRKLPECRGHRFRIKDRRHLPRSLALLVG